MTFIALLMVIAAGSVRNGAQNRLVQSGFAGAQPFTWCCGIAGPCHLLIILGDFVADVSTTHGAGTEATMPAPCALSAVELCEFGRTPAIAAIPTRLANMTDSAAAAINGWIRLEV